MIKRLLTATYDTLAVLVSSRSDVGRAIKMVIIVRTDLKLGPGKMGSQCAHAAVSLVASTNPSTLASWMSVGQPKIVLRADSESQLKDLYSQARKDQINAFLVYDAGQTQVKQGTLTALGLGPNDVTKIDQLTKNLKLL